MSRPVQFALVGDDFKVQYVGKGNAEQLINAIKTAGYDVAIEWEGSLYCGMTLEWNYNEQWLDISMQGYIGNLRNRHDMPVRI